MSDGSRDDRPGIFQFQKLPEQSHIVKGNPDLCIISKPVIMPHQESITPWYVNFIFTVETGWENFIFIRSITVAYKDQTFFKKRNCLDFFEKMWIGNKTEIYFFIFYGIVGQIRPHGIQMQTAFFVCSQKTADHLWHKIKIQTVYISNTKQSRRFSQFELAGFQPQLFPFLRNRYKALPCLCKFQNPGAFMAFDEFCSKFFFQGRQTMAQCRL